MLADLYSSSYLKVILALPVYVQCTDLSEAGFSTRSQLQELVSGEQDQGHVSSYQVLSSCLSLALLLGRGLVA